MKVETLIVTCQKDSHWLEHCLNSLQKFMCLDVDNGFGDIKLSVAESEKDFFLGMLRNRYPLLPLRLRTYDRHPDSRLWHIQHQLQKCLADLYCPDADLIWFIDSDCFLVEPITPDDYRTPANTGKLPLLLVEPFERMPSSPWKATSERALGHHCEYETMRRHGALHHRGMFEEMRKRVVQVNHMPFADYIMGCKPEYPWGVSEFNLMGNFVMESDWHSLYHFHDVSLWGWPKDKLIDVWSHAPISASQGDRYRGLFPKEMTVQQIFDKLGI